MEANPQALINNPANDVYDIVKRFVCVNCGKEIEINKIYKNESKSQRKDYGNGVFYVIYPNSNTIRLARCPECRNPVDRYIEIEFLIIIFDVILLRLSAFRHLLFNRQALLLSYQNLFLWLRYSLIIIIIDAFIKLHLFSSEIGIKNMTPSEEVFKYAGYVLVLTALEHILFLLFFIFVSFFFFPMKSMVQVIALGVKSLFIIPGFGKSLFFLVPLSIWPAYDPWILQVLLISLTAAAQFQGTAVIFEQYSQAHKSIHLLLMSTLIIFQFALQTALFSSVLNYDAAHRY